MSFSRDDAINSIVDLKKQWADANAAGDETKKNEAAKNAQEYYNKLYSYGYGDVADELNKSDYTAAKGVRDKYLKMDKSNGTDYLTNLAGSYGLSSTDVANLMKYDSATGQFTFGGKNIGNADAVIDGVGYWSDTGVLKNVWDDYVSTSGITKSKSTMVDQGNADITTKYQEIFDTAANENPYETEVGKSIMGKYNLAAIQGRENQLASGAATNGGNIDSFSAANAMRQQAALIYQGQDAVLAAHQQKIDNAQKILEGMGVHINRIFEQDETAKNNEVSRNVAVSEVTGYVPNEWAIKNDDLLSTYLNEDGSFKTEYEDVDFQQLINNAKAAGDTETARKYAIIRTRKMLGNMAEYGKYMNEGDTAYMTPQETAAVKQANANRESAEEIAKGQQEGVTANAVAQAEMDAYYDGQYETILNLFSPTETRKRAFVTDKLKPLLDEAKKGNKFTQVEISDLIQKYTADYNIDKTDAEAICNMFGVSTGWLDAWEDDADNPYGGMVRKEVPKEK